MAVVCACGRETRGVLISLTHRESVAFRLPCHPFFYSTGGESCFDNSKSGNWARLFETVFQSPPICGYFAASNITVSRWRGIHSLAVASMMILGNPITIEGAEYSNTQAIYICNHASPLDIFLMMWLTPTGTVGIAKKEIIWYPLFGQLYVLANHLRIDRSNPTSAIESMRKAAHAVVKNKLSLIIFPEGTRSETGRLLPFKKGFVHMALQTQLPIVSIILTGTHLAWRKNSLRVRPAALTVKYLPPIKTDNWNEDNIVEYVQMVHALYEKHLPETQKPLV